MDSALKSKNGKKEVIMMANIEIFNLTQDTINIVDEDNVTILKIVS